MIVSSRRPTGRGVDNSMKSTGCERHMAIGHPRSKSWLLGVKRMSIGRSTNCPEGRSPKSFSKQNRPTRSSSPEVNGLNKTHSELT
jgi:hypothetical protein